MGSSRLPGKVLKNFCGLPMLQFQIDLIQKYDLGLKIVVATSDNIKDLEIIDFCKCNNFNYAIGSENNVLDRFCNVVEEYKFSKVIRLTSDNPLVSYSIINDVIKFGHGKKDLVTTRKINTDGSIIRFVPKGLSIDLINSESLTSLNQDNLNKFEKEHVIPVFFNGKYDIKIIKSNFGYKNNLSIDTLEDFNNVAEFTKEMIKKNKLNGYLGFER